MNNPRSNATSPFLSTFLEGILVWEEYRNLRNVLSRPDDTQQQALSEKENIEHPYKEHERKFLVKQLPDLTGKEKFNIQQHYLFSKGTMVRIRQKNTDYFLTIKQGEECSKTEVEIPLSHEEYQSLLPLSQKNIKKTRYKIPLNNKDIAELDIFPDERNNIQLVEVEFQNKKEMNSFIPPEWFGKEVSNDKTYANKNLALPTPKIP